MKTGIELISEERQVKQIEKHGFTGEHHAKHPEWYDKGQLLEAATALLIAGNKPYLWYPENWNKEWFYDLCSKPHKERLVIAAAMTAAEIDRVQYLENNKP